MTINAKSKNSELPQLLNMLICSTTEVLLLVYIGMSDEPKTKPLPWEMAGIRINEGLQHPIPQTSVIHLAESTSPI